VVRPYQLDVIIDAILTTMGRYCVSHRLGVLRESSFLSWITVIKVQVLKKVKQGSTRHLSDLENSIYLVFILCYGCNKLR